MEWLHLQRWPRVLQCARVLLTFHLVLLAWVLFRAETFSHYPHRVSLAAGRQSRDAGRADRPQLVFAVLGIIGVQGMDLLAESAPSRPSSSVGLWAWWGAHVSPGGGDSGIRRIPLKAVSVFSVLSTPHMTLPPGFARFARRLALQPHATAARSAGAIRDAANAAPLRHRIDVFGAPRRTSSCLARRTCRSHSTTRRGTTSPFASPIALGWPVLRVLLELHDRYRRGNPPRNSSYLIRRSMFRSRITSRCWRCSRRLMWTRVISNHSDADQPVLRVWRSVPAAAFDPLSGGVKVGENAELRLCRGALSGLFAERLDHAGLPRDRGERIGYRRDGWSMASNVIPARFFSRLCASRSRGERRSSR